MLLTSALRGIDISVQASPCRQRDFVRHFHGMVEGRVSEIAKRGKGRWWVGINEERERERKSERGRGEEIRWTNTSYVGIIFTSAKITRIRADKS